MQKQRSVKNQIISVLLFLLTTGFITVAVFLPGDLVRKEALDEVGQVMSVPVEYYSAPSEALVKNISRQLTEQERLSLIYGDWESTIQEASDKDVSLTEYEVVHLEYPIDSRYQPWYTWEATPYKAVDTTFKTYAAIFWKVTFTKYDGSESFVYYITENGTLLDLSRLPKEFREE